MRIVDISNHYIFTDLEEDLANEVAAESITTVYRAAQNSINPDWPATVQHILNTHARALWEGRMEALRVEQNRESADANYRRRDYDVHKLWTSDLVMNFGRESTEEIVDERFQALKDVVNLPNGKAIGLAGVVADLQKEIVRLRETVDAAKNVRDADTLSGLAGSTGQRMRLSSVNFDGMGDIASAVFEPVKSYSMLVD